MTQPDARNGMSSGLSHLTKVALADVEVRRVSLLHGLRLRAAESVNDPVYLLMNACSESAEIRAGWGVKVELAFSMGTARTVGGDQEILHAHALGQIA